MKKQIQWSTYKEYALLFLAILIFCGVCKIAGIPCPIKYVSGISCPGCGMTRACLAALHFQFADAFVYHPLWPALLPMLCALTICRFRGWEKAFQWLLYIGVALMLVTYVIRMIRLTDSEIVVFAPSSGLLARLVKQLFSV